MCSTLRYCFRSLICTLLVIATLFIASLRCDNVELTVKLPTVMIAVLVRNKEHTLPYFFSYLEDLDYPKDRVSLWIRSDHNEDRSIDITKTWLKRCSSLYHSVDFKYRSEGGKRESEKSYTHWNEDRFADVIRLKEEALQTGRRIWADYIFFLDADVFLTNTKTLQALVDLKMPIVAPMLVSDALYSNFWCGMTADYYYQRTEDYKKILNYELTGQWPVPMVHSAVLIDLNVAQTHQLTFERRNLPSDRYHGPMDDIIIFAMSANYSGIPMRICNAVQYGYIMVPLEAGETIPGKDWEQLTNVLGYIVSEYGEVKLKDDLQKYVPVVSKDKLSLSRIIMINLERRVERRTNMLKHFDLLGLQVDHFPAVDGKQLTDEKLQQMGIRFLPGYADPFHKRPMTMGEIGCFLSHYYIWEEMVRLEQKEVLVLEDDIRFEPFFRRRAYRVLQDARRIGGWDLIYFGRKRLQEEDEKWIDGSEYLVKAGYSYWTLGYVITLEGAKKLLREKPLEKLVPVDEYIPIMFDNHPNDSWAEHFHDRTLNAWSAAPLLLYPTHYTGDEGYISDTEDSARITGSLPAAAGKGGGTVVATNETVRDGKAAEPKKGDKEQLPNAPNLLVTESGLGKSEVNRRSEL
ncbi:glycosyltransferase 25 family member isoform X1 [Anopheles cruzii]|uniref:glycosyltransferase 25 family member isoform X1 n=1 Tax=Anopheles cruzii TaxID=68878 RepID=UPI0022EC1F71|nr:glycosyltransferase 25 family member isoform X1 [Anopheles cruzii]